MRVLVFIAAVDDRMVALFSASYHNFRTRATRTKVRQLYGIALGGAAFVLASLPPFKAR